LDRAVAGASSQAGVPRRPRSGWPLPSDAVERERDSALAAEQPARDYLN
jgi:hypothetical protein